MDPAEDIAEGFLAALETESDEWVYRVHLHANTDHEGYLAAWALLDAPVRAAIKLAIERYEHQGWISCGQ